ncbi:MAG: hypothetical protein R2831_05095 [Chitinophagaceae bacterium]
MNIQNGWNELPKVKPFQFSDTSQKEKVAFLFNSETFSIWKELSEHISNEKVIEITYLLSDINGKALQELKSIFPSAEINVVLDESGFLCNASKQKGLLSLIGVMQV